MQNVYRARLAGMVLPLLAFVTVYSENTAFAQGYYQQNYPELGGYYSPAFQSSWDAWQRGDARRLAGAQHQLYLNDVYRQERILAARWYEYHRPFYQTLPTPWVPQVNQPIGREEIQTGPNRWESRPVYAEPIRDPFVPRVNALPTPEEMPPARQRNIPRRGIEF